jgi:hypothetical protein
MDGEHGAATPFKWATATDGCCELLKAWLEGVIHRQLDQRAVVYRRCRVAMAGSGSGTECLSAVWLSVGKSFLALLHLGYLLHHLPIPESKVLVLRNVVMMELPICL